MPLNWNDKDTLYGIDVKAIFFDGDKARAETDMVRRVIPFLEPAKPKPLFTETDRKNFFTEHIAAQPDVVFEHKNGLISIEYKHVNFKPHHPPRWREEIRLLDMLQCVIAAFVVAQNFKKPTACVLRYHNVAYFLSPKPQLLKEIFALVRQAKDYHQQGRYVATKDLASFVEDKVKKLYPPPESERAKAGRRAHEEILRR